MELSAERLTVSVFPTYLGNCYWTFRTTFPTPEHWLLLGKTAYETKDPNLVTAMSSAYKLRPDDYVVMNNYAAALLSHANG
jgi:hypothetical protein